MNVVAVVPGSTTPTRITSVGSLELLGHRIQHWGQPAATLADRCDYDAIIVDGVHDPEAARTYCRDLTALAVDVPIVLAIGPRTLHDLAPEWGFSEFVLDTCSIGELQARLLRLAVARRLESPTSVRQYGLLSLDGEHLNVFDGETVTSLTRIEHSMLTLFLDNPYTVLTRETIRRDAWVGAKSLSSRNIDTYVCRIRRKLGSNGKYIQTIRSVGYRFTMPPTEALDNPGSTRQRSAA